MATIRLVTLNTPLYDRVGYTLYTVATNRLVLDDRLVRGKLYSPSQLS